MCAESETCRSSGCRYQLWFSSRLVRKSLTVMGCTVRCFPCCSGCCPPRLGWAEGAAPLGQIPPGAGGWARLGPCPAAQVRLFHLPQMNLQWLWCDGSQSVCSGFAPEVLEPRDRAGNGPVPQVLPACRKELLKVSRCDPWPFLTEPTVCVGRVGKYSVGHSTNLQFTFWKCFIFRATYIKTLESCVFLGRLSWEVLFRDSASLAGVCS